MKGIKGKLEISKGFTMVELIVVIAVLGVLVLLAMPMFNGYTKDANFTKGIANAKMIEDASELYYMDNEDWPRLTDEHYTQEQMEEYAERFYDNTGKEIELDPNGKYYDIDYDGLNKYVKVNDDKRNYILQNPVGKVYYMEDITDRGLNRVDYEDNVVEDEINNDDDSVEDDEDTVIARDGDFIWVDDNNGYNNNGIKGYYKYIGENKNIKVPKVIGGLTLTSYYNMFNSSEVEKVVSDNPNVVDMSYMFSNNKANKLDLTSLDTSNVVNMNSMFRGTRMEELDLSSFDTSNVTNMTYMFSDSNSKKINLSGFDTSKVINMGYMFQSTKVSVLDLSSFETSEKTLLNYMFHNSEAREGYARTGADAGRFNETRLKPDGLVFKIKSNSDYTWVNDEDGYEVNGTVGYYKYIGDSKVIEIPNELEGNTLTSYYKMFESSDVNKVISNNPNITNMSYMFYKSTGTNLDLSSLNTSNVTNMSSLFRDNRATSLDLSSFDTSNVTDMRYMFRGSKATSINLSSFDTSNVTDMSYMFQVSNVENLDLSSFDTSNSPRMTYMFHNSEAREGYARTGADAGRFNATGLKPAGLVFKIKSNHDYTWINDENGYEVNGAIGYYKYIGNDKTVRIPHKLEGKTLTSYYKMFESTDATKVISDNPNITNMSYMFYRSTGTNLDLSSLNTSNVTNMSSLFRDNRATSLDLSSFDTSKVTDMRYMFRGSKATSINLSSFDTSNVTNMSYMFQISNAEVLDLSSFDTSNNPKMTYMFESTKAKEVYARTTSDMERFSSTGLKPKDLIFKVK